MGQLSRVLNWLLGSPVTRSDSAVKLFVSWDDWEATRRRSEETGTSFEETVVAAAVEWSFPCAAETAWAQMLRRRSESADDDVSVRAAKKGGHFRL